MLMSSNKAAKSDNKYKCDMCRTFLSSEKRVTISKAIGYENPKKKWDLCADCYKLLNRSIERWYIKNMKSRG